MATKSDRKFPGRITITNKKTGKKMVLVHKLWLARKKKKEEEERKKKMKERRDRIRKEKSKKV